MIDAITQLMQSKKFNTSQLGLLALVIAVTARPDAHFLQVGITAITCCALLAQGLADFGHSAQIEASKIQPSAEK